VLFEHNREALATSGEDNIAVFEHLRAAGYRTLLLWDSYSRFLLSASLENGNMIQDLHDYVAFDREYVSKVGYWDLCAFHESDDDVAARCLATERRIRLRATPV
jgi:hypothetical protein